MRTTLRKDEKILLIVREHWLILLFPAIGTAFMITLAIIASYYYPRFWWIGAIVAFIAVCKFIWKILERIFNIWIVTNLRIIDEFGVLSSHSMESPLEKINNVEYDQSMWGRLFKYGDVTLQTAAEMGETVYLFLVRPKRLQTVIFNAQGALKNNQMKQNAQYIADALHGAKNENDSPHFTEKLERLYQLKLKGILTEREYNLRKQKLMSQ